MRAMCSLILGDDLIGKIAEHRRARRSFIRHAVDAVTGEAIQRTHANLVLGGSFDHRGVSVRPFIAQHVPTVLYPQIVLERLGHRTALVQGIKVRLVQVRQQVLNIERLDLHGLQFLDQQRLARLHAVRLADQYAV